MSYDGPDAIAPDTKNWTWVLDRSCPQCGLDTRTVEPIEVAGRLHAVASDFATVLRRGDVRDRPGPGVWSPLEYGCHVRDVFRIYDQRLALMLTEDDPLFPNWDQDDTAVAERYGEQDPATVAGQLQDAGTALAAHFDQVRDDQWDRPGRRSDGAEFTVATFARYFIHDPVHHLWDVTR
jgi:DinB superfamily